MSTPRKRLVLGSLLLVGIIGAALMLTGAPSLAQQNKPDLQATLHCVPYMVGTSDPAFQGTATYPEAIGFLPGAASYPYSCALFVPPDVIREIVYITIDPYVSEARLNTAISDFLFAKYSTRSQGRLTKDGMFFVPISKAR